MWFSPRRSIAHRFFVVLMLLIAGGTFMYVWCELFTPRWYEGRLRNRFGMFITSSERRILEAVR